MSSHNINNSDGSSGQHKHKSPSLWRPVTLRTITAVSVVCIFFLASLDSLTTMAEAKNQKDGKIAQKLDEYHTTIKCVLNIAEETLPELNDFVTCCGFWALHDFLIHKVDDECEPQNLQQVKHLAGAIVPHVRDQCIGYEHGSFTCRLLVIMPITFAVLFIALIIGINICACVSLYKWITVRRKYRRVVNLNTANEMKSTMNKGKFLPDDP